MKRSQNILETDRPITSLTTESPKPNEVRSSPSRRSAQKYSTDTHLRWYDSNKDETHSCTFHKADTPRNLPRIKLNNDEIKSVAMTSLVRRRLTIDDTIQCRDTRSQDPLKRDYWYDDTVVSVYPNNKDRDTLNYVVQPPKGDQVENVKTQDVHNMLWKRYQPDTVMYRLSFNRIT